MKGHEKLHVNARAYVCNLCGKGYNTKKDLNVHSKSKAHNAQYKPIKNKKYECKTYRCQQCVPSILFLSAAERALHRNAMHKTFECDVCKNTFITLESLESHKALHSDKPRSFVCTVCINLTVFRLVRGRVSDFLTILTQLIYFVSFFMNLVKVLLQHFLKVR